MHTALLNLVISRCRRRIDAGDCPTEKGLPVETLEDAVVQLADQMATIQKTSENAQALATRYEDALWLIAEVGDGYGPRSRISGTNGEGHAECREIADSVLGIVWEDLPEDGNMNTPRVRERHKARVKGEGK